MLFFGKSKKQNNELPRTPAPERLSESVVEPLVLTEANADAAAQKPVDPRRRRRPTSNKTRLMGFDTSDSRVVDLFDEESAASAQTGRCAFPVGWVMVKAGPGKGECFALLSGMSQIGRGDDQAVRLDFGDMAISRANHAAIVYDPQKHTFLLGHGGKANLVRLNGEPVVSTHDLNDGDTIEIGETSLCFKALCSAAFNWTETEAEGDEDDVEIA